MNEWYLPTSPGLTRPPLARKQGTEAAVFSSFGASITIMGDPISIFDTFFDDDDDDDDDDSFNSHFIS